MNTQITGTVEDGALKLDERLDFPDQMKVHVTVVPAPGESVDESWRQRYREGIEELRELIRTHPIRAGIRYTREELHDRRGVP